jgi:hypothetical protein
LAGSFEVGGGVVSVAMIAPQGRIRVMYPGGDPIKPPVQSPR